MARADHPIQYKEAFIPTQLSRRAAINRLMAAALSSVTAAVTAEELLDADCDLATPLCERHLLRLAIYEMETATAILRSRLRASRG